jgi:uncharacterized membrane protein
VCARSHYQCWVVRAGVILFKSFHVLLPAYVDEDSRPARARSAKFAESICAHEFNDHIGIFSQDILFFTYYMTLRTQYRDNVVHSKNFHCELSGG